MSFCFFVFAGSLVEDPAMDCLISLRINRAQGPLRETLRRLSLSFFRDNLKIQSALQIRNSVFQLLIPFFAILAD